MPTKSCLWLQNGLSSGVLLYCSCVYVNELIIQCSDWIQHYAPDGIITIIFGLFLPPSDVFVYNPGVNSTDCGSLSNSETLVEACIPARIKNIGKAILKKTFNLCRYTYKNLILQKARNCSQDILVVVIWMSSSGLASIIFSLFSFSIILSDSAIFMLSIWCLLAGVG